MRSCGGNKHRNGYGRRILNSLDCPPPDWCRSMRAFQAGSCMILVFWLCIFIWIPVKWLSFRDSVLLDYASDPVE